MLNNRILPKAVDKIPGYCKDPTHLQAGDILIFNINSAHANANARRTVAANRWLNNPGGHEEAIHVGFVVEINWQKKMAHLRAQGFLLQDIDSEIIQTTTHIYRPRVFRNEIVMELNKLIRHNQENFQRNVKWKYLTSFFAWLGRLINAVGIRDENPNDAAIVKKPEDLPLPKQMISSWNMCSKFLAESYTASCYSLSKSHGGKDYRHHLMNINNTTVPKTLQAYLYRCSNYKYLVMPHKDERGQITMKLIQYMREEAARLCKENNKKAQAKGQMLTEQLDTFEQHNSELKRITVQEFERAKQDFESAKALLSIMVPLLKINTGHHIKTPASYRRVMDYAESQGLAAYYFEKELHFNDRLPDLTEQAAECYQYDDKLSQLYSSYRRAGYSDREARFECEPQFTKWFHLSPRRNLVAACTVVPFLFVSIPLAFWRTYKAHHRNKALYAENLSPRPY